VRSQVNGPDDQSTRETEVSLAAALVNQDYDQKKVQEALSIYAEVLPFFEKVDHGEGHRVAMVNANIGSAYKSKGDLKRSIPYFLKGLELESRDKMQDKFAYLEYANTLADTYFELNDYADAARYYAQLTYPLILARRPETVIRSICYVLAAISA